MGMKGYRIGLVVLLAGLLLVPARGEAAPGHWGDPYRSAVEEAGIRRGDPAWDPGGAIPREQFADMLVRVAWARDARESPVPGSVAERIRQGVREGLLPPDAPGAPGSPLLRREAALWGARQIPAGAAPGGAVPRVADWERLVPGEQQALETLGRAGILRGGPDGRFRPEDPLTQAEACVMAFRLLVHQPGDRGETDLPAVPAEVLLDPGSYGPPSRFMYGILCQAGVPTIRTNPESVYPVRVGRFRVLAPPVLTSSRYERGWVAFPLGGAARPDLVPEVFLVSRDPPGLRWRLPAAEYLFPDNQGVTVLLPVVSFFDAARVAPDGTVEWGYDDGTWSRFEGACLVGILLRDPLFPGEVLYLEIQRREAGV